MSAQRTSPPPTEKGSEPPSPGRLNPDVQAFQINA